MIEPGMMSYLCIMCQMYQEHNCNAGLNCREEYKLRSENTRMREALEKLSFDTIKIDELIKTFPDTTLINALLCVGETARSAIPMLKKS